MSSLKPRLLKLEAKQNTPMANADEKIVISSDPIIASKQYQQLMSRPCKLPKVTAPDTTITPEEALASYERIMLS